MDELVSFERRLLRDARMRSGSGDPDLETILQRVANRRARRFRPGAVDGNPASAPAPGPADDGPTRVLAIERVAADVLIMRVTRPASLRFQAGQHLKLGPAGGRQGTFSIASAPHEPYLEFCIELIPGGQVTPALFALAPGAAVDLADGAKGALALAAAAQHLMVATVTGIAPLRSLLRDALHRGVDGRFLVLHGASHADDLPYRAELDALGASDERIEYRPTVSRPGLRRNAGWLRDVGRVDDLARRVAGSLDSAQTHVYACGNPGMVERMDDELGRMGFDVSTEKFD